MAAKNNVDSSDFSLSETDSSISSDADSDQDREQDLLVPSPAVVQPYQHEPRRKGSPPPLSPLEQQRKDRVGRNDWCLCGNCSHSVDAANLHCCRETPELAGKLKEEACVTLHRGFQLNGLETEVLDAVYHHFRTRLYSGKNCADKMRRYRYTAYRNVIAWAWGKMGKGNRTPLPACVVQKIRSTFPDPQGRYLGYQHK